MIEDLFDKRFGYESIDIYLNDKIVPFEYIQHFISKIDSLACFFAVFEPFYIYYHFFF